MTLNKKVREITFVAIFVSIISVVSQIAIPMPTGVPITMQIFVIALAGYYLKLRHAVLSTFVYILLGGIGIPVFSGFNGGFHVLIGPTGGFVWGFLIVAILCSAFAKSRVGIPLGMASVLLCHACGIIQYTIVMQCSPWVSFLSVSLPYILKDIIFIPIAYVIALKINKRVTPYRL